MTYLYLQTNWNEAKNFIIYYFLRLELRYVVRTERSTLSLKNLDSAIDHSLLFNNITNLQNSIQS